VLDRWPQIALVVIAVTSFLLVALLIQLAGDLLT